MLMNGAIITLVIAPLIAGSMWIYSASSAAFQFQHDIREAQNARNRLIRAFLATESDVRGFAATKDPYFAASYHARVDTFNAMAVTFQRDLRQLHLVGADSIIARELRTYARWNRMVALPIINRSRSDAPYLLRVADPVFAARMLGDDRGAEAMLENAAAASEIGRERLLRDILFLSVALVAAVASTGVVLLLRHAAAEQRELTQTALYEDERRISRMLQLALAPETFLQLLA